MTKPELKILLVEDDEDDFLLFRDLLSEITSTKFAVDWVSSYEKGRESIKNVPYDVYVFDYRLGSHDGLELLRETLDRGCQRPVILLTGQDDHETDVRATEAGAADYLVKGRIDAEALERSIRYALEHSRVLMELREARDAALTASRLKSAFIRNISHEVRTPLNVILGYSSVLADYLEQNADESQKEALEAINRQGQRLVATMNGIMEIAKLEAGDFNLEPRKLMIDALVREQMEAFDRPAKDKGLILSLDNEEPLAEVQFDEHCLAQSMTNLLQNAIKFTERGGVMARLFRGADRRLRLAIHDTGIGIGDAFLSKVGEPFSQEQSGFTRHFEGCGLGLALTKRYLELNHADLSVESEKGEGTTFTVVFAPDKDRDLSRPWPSRALKKTSPMRSTNGLGSV